MSALREKWILDVAAVLQQAKSEIEKALKTTINVSWDSKVNIVEPKFKIMTRLPHHLPYVLPDKKNGPKAHLTDSKSVAVAAIEEIWNKYQEKHSSLLDYNLWLKNQLGSKTGNLTNEEFAELMRAKRDARKEKAAPKEG